MIDGFNFNKLSEDEIFRRIESIEKLIIMRLDANNGRMDNAGTQMQNLVISLKNELTNRGNSSITNDTKQAPTSTIIGAEANFSSVFPIINLNQKE
jgi:hypothetical protein